MRLVDPARGEARREPEWLADKKQRLDQDRKRLRELLFATSCNGCNKMAATPQGAFAAVQVRKNFKRLSNKKYEQENDDDNAKADKNYGFNSKALQEGREPTPLKYNSKLMNSIWGLYNRYSVHNFKKIDANEAGLLAGAWGTLSPGKVVVGKGPGIGGR